MAYRPQRFEVHRGADAEHGDEGDLIAVGARFPTGECALMWRQEAFPEEAQTRYLTMSIYGDLDDVELTTGGSVEMVDGERTPAVSPDL